jgi:hypothetical protein
MNKIIKKIPLILASSIVVAYYILFNLIFKIWFVVWVLMIKGGGSYEYCDGHCATVTGILSVFVLIVGLASTLFWLATADMKTGIERIKTFFLGLFLVLLNTIGLGMVDGILINSEGYRMLSFGFVAVLAVPVYCIVYFIIPSIGGSEY